MGATTLHHRALLRAGPNSPAGPALTHDPSRVAQPQGHLPAALPPASHVSNGPDKVPKLEMKAAEAALNREDAELAQRAAAERRGVPSNVEGFK